MVSIQIFGINLNTGVCYTHTNVSATLTYYQLVSNLLSLNFSPITLYIACFAQTPGYIYKLNFSS